MTIREREPKQEGISKLQDLFLLRSREGLLLPIEYPFPYTPEKFTEEEKQILNRFFTNTNRPVFAIHGLPQEVVGALFSRYSRSAQSVRRIFLDEFWKSSELGIGNIASYLAQEEGEQLATARSRAESFYRRVYAEYGDDSVIQMGSVHIAFEGVSQIAAKAIEDQRIAAAYIEKSTRYVNFSDKVDGHFLFMEPTEIMNSPFAQEFLNWNNALFEAYIKHLPSTIELLRRRHAIEEQEFESTVTGRVVNFDELTASSKKRVRIARERALKAKALDTVRIFLPTTTVTNLGAHFSGQAAENTLNKMMSSQYSEVRLLGAMALAELLKVAPSFIQNVDHRYGVVQREYIREVRQKQAEVTTEWLEGIEEANQVEVRLVDWDKDADVKIATQILYTGQKNTHYSKDTIRRRLEKIKDQDLSNNYESIWWSPRLAEIVLKSSPDRRIKGRNRRHKLPRAFEHAYAEVEFNLDFGVYRDLQRNRMMSLERQRLSAEELFVPEEFQEPGMEEVRADYLRLAEWTRNLHRKLLTSGDPQLETAAEYVTILGNKLRFNVRANIRQWAFFAELRTIPGGHKTYRQAMQNSVRQILDKLPYLNPLFAHVDRTADYGLGRLKAELRTQRKLAQT